MRRGGGGPGPKSSIRDGHSSDDVGLAPLYERTSRVRVLLYSGHYGMEHVDRAVAASTHFRSIAIGFRASMPYAGVPPRDSNGVLNWEAGATPESNSGALCLHTLSPIYACRRLGL